MESSSPSPNPYSTPESAPSDPGFRDMRTLLTVTGILLILAGASCACFGGVYGLFLPAMVTYGPEDSPELEAMTQELGGSIDLLVGVGLMMAVMATGLIWLGIGSIRCRKWARDLAFSLGWMFGGVMLASALGTIFTLPKMIGSMNTAMPSGSAGGLSTGIAMIIGMVVGFGFYLVPAVVLIVVYGLKNVRLTVQHHDPSSPWTDRVPIPVQAWWLLLVWSSATLFAMAPTYGSFFVGLGVAPNALIAGLLLSGTGVVLAVLSWAIATRKDWAWPASLALVLFSVGWSLFVFQKADMIGAYENMGMSEEQLEMMRSMYGEDFGVFFLPMVVVAVACLAFLILTRKQWYEPRTL